VSAESQVGDKVFSFWENKAWSWHGPFYKIVRTSCVQTLT
jgi:hypothetical protein